MIGKPTLQPAPGILLIASANLLDPNFSRTVILLCEHQLDGTFGLVLNNELPLSLSHVVELSGDWDAPLFKGGPVQENTLHFVHTRHDIDIGSQEILPGVFWGGDFDKLNRLISAGEVRQDEARFFIGYSGWGEGQLAEEIERDSWYLTPAAPPLIFAAGGKNHWRQVLRQMGPDYAVVANFPDDPRLN